MHLSKYTNPTEGEEDKRLPDTVREAGCPRIDIGQSGGQGQGGGLASTIPFGLNLNALHDAT